jgi:ABC-2 type transport system permease protein
MGMTAMYAGMYPAFKDSLSEIMESGIAEGFSFFRGAEDMASYVGFLNMELYQIFWIMILGIILGFLSGSIIAKEIEGKTIDLLMSNPVSKKQIIFEKFLGLTPMILIINIATMLTVFAITIVINEELNFVNVALAHIASIPYFLSIISIGILVSVIVNEKMKASIIMIAIIVGMFIFESVSNMVPEYESIGIISLTHYYNPLDALKYGNIDIAGLIILLVVTVWSLIIAMIYFEYNDILY